MASQRDMMERAGERAGGHQAPPYRKWSEYLADEDLPVPDYIAQRRPLDLAAAGVSFRVDSAEFTSREFAAREKERLWQRVWQIAARENDIPEPGDYIEYEIVGISIIVVRGKDGEVRAFRNACRHRGTALVDGRGSAKCFVCPYHAWTYNLDGTLRSLPAQWDFPGLDRAEHALLPCKAEAFAGWVFVNLDLDAAPLAEFLGPDMTSQLAARPIQRLRKHFHLGMVVACNWKIMAHTFMESYHISRTHPQIAGFVGDVQGEFDFLGWHMRGNTPGGVPSVIGGRAYSEQEALDQSIAFNTGRFGDAGKAMETAATVPEGQTARKVMAGLVREQMSGLDLSAVTDTEIIDPITWSVFPNAALLNHAPGQLNFRFRPHGDDPNQCLFEIFALAAVPEGEPLERDAGLTMALPGQTLADHADRLGAGGPLLDQDIANTIAEQKGLNAGLGQIVLARSMEASIAWYHHCLGRWMAGAPAPLEKDGPA